MLKVYRATFFVIFGLSCALGGLLTPPETAADPPLAQVILSDILEVALQHNPRLAAERARLAGMRAERLILDGFFDPQLHASGGRRDGYAGHPAWVAGDSMAIQADLEWALPPGVYFHLGGSEHYYLNRGEQDPLYRTLAGVRAVIPLWRDRGFRQWQIQERQAMEQARAAAFRALTVAQEIHRDLMHAYIDWLQRQAILNAVNDGLERVLKLLEETEHRIALDAAPAYQLHAARMEVALRRDERNQTEATVQSSLALLREQTGMSLDESALSADASDLADWAYRVAQSPLPAASVASAMQARGDMLALQALLHAAQAAEARAADARRPDLSVSIGAGLRHDRVGDGFDAPDDSDDTFGYEAAIRWRQPLGGRAERARLASRQADRLAVDEDIRALQARIERELTVAEEHFRTARGRLSFAREAVQEAEQALLAETNRFQLGQSRNRDVLDAQIDLTNAIRREAAAAADTLRAMADWLHAGGQTGPHAAVSMLAEPD